MRARVLLGAFVLALCATAAASHPRASAASEPVEPSELHTDPETGERYRLERPSEGLRRGAWQVPGWVVAAAGATLGVAAAALLGWRALRRRR